MSVLGGIEIQLLADSARLMQDLGKAKDHVGKFASSAKSMLGALGVGISVAGMAAWIKSAIDAADESSKLGQKVGIATKDLAGMQLAFRQAGVGGHAMQTALVKLAKNVAEGDAVFVRMGVSVRNADGSLKSSKQVLYDLADRFAAMPDGINKTALATEMFGKAGADLVPLLNGGSEGLREMAAWAERLGLVIDHDTGKAAEEFNDTLDLLGQSGQGMARQIAAQLLPTLKGLAGSLLDNVTSGDKLKRAADFLATGLKLLFAGGAIGVEVFATLGRVLGGVAGAVIAVAQGEFRVAGNILREMGGDVKRGWGDTAKTIEAAWAGSGAATVDAASKMTRAIKGTTVQTKEQADAAKKHADEQAKLTKAGADYVRQIDQQLAAQRQELALGRALSDGEKEALKLDEQLASGKIRLTDVQIAAVRAKLRDIDAIKEQRVQQAEYLKTVAAVAQHASKWTDSQIQATEAMRGVNVALSEENEKLKLGETAWEQRRATVLLNQAADLEWQAASQGGNFQLEEQARLLRDRATLLQEGTVLKEAKAAAGEWKKTTDSINAGLTDALMRAFEAGKGFWQAFRDTLVNAAKTLILKPVIELVMRPVSGGIAALLGSASATAGQVSGMGGAGAGGASLLDSATWASAARGVTGGLGTAGQAVAGTWNYGAAYSGSTYGTAFGSQQSAMLAAQDAGMGTAAGGWGGTMGTAASTALGIMGGIYGGRAISGGYSTGGSGNANVNTGTAIGAVVGTIVPVIGTALGALVGGLIGGAVNRAFGRKNPEVGDQGVTGAFGGGGFAGNQFRDWSQQGGWFRSDRSWTDYQAVDAELSGALQGGARAVLEQAKQYGRALALPVDQLARVTTSARITFTGDAAKTAKAITDALGAYGDALVGTYAQQLAGAGQAGESTLQTLERLGTRLLSLNSVFETLGLRLADTSVAGGRAASELVDLTGGLEAFLGKTQAYLGNYFTQSEQFGITARMLLGSLGEAGINFGGASQRQELRTLMESLDVNSQTGRMQMAALFNVAADFAKVADYLQTSGLTLEQLAAQAPGGYVALGRKTTDPVQDRSHTLMQGANDRLDTIVSVSQASNTELQTLVSLQSAANAVLIAKLDALARALDESTRPQYLFDLNPGS